MRKVVLTVILGVAILALGVFFGRRPAGESLPNVVFVLIDTLRADRVYAERNGVPVMPYLASLADTSMNFSHATAPSSWTRPSMASIFTSRYVEAHQVYYSGRYDKERSDVLAEDWLTLAEFLQQNGYDTLAFQTNGNLTEKMGFAQGFTKKRYIFSLEAVAEEVTNRLLERLPELKPPFYIYAHYQDPHVPYTPPERYRARFGPMPKLSEFDKVVFSSRKRFMEFYTACVDLFLGRSEAIGMPMLSPAGKETVRTLYDGESRYTDDEVHRFVEYIRRKYPNTLVIITADHGEEFWERGGMGHGTSLFEEQIHVPLILNGPGIAPKTIDGTVEIIGILPTIAAYLGLPVDPGWQGRDLRQPPPEEGNTSYARTFGPWTPLNVDVTSINRDGNKLILDISRNIEHLYHLNKEPGERNNRAAEEPERVNALKAVLKVQDAQNLQRRSTAPAPETIPLDEETFRTLEALGYLGNKKPSVAP